MCGPGIEGISTTKMVVVKALFSCLDMTGKLGPALRRRAAQDQMVHLQQKMRAAISERVLSACQQAIDIAVSLGHTAQGVDAYRLMRRRRKFAQCQDDRVEIEHMPAGKLACDSCYRILPSKASARSTTAEGSGT